MITTLRLGKSLDLLTSGNLQQVVMCIIEGPIYKMAEMTLGQTDTQNYLLTEMQQKTRPDAGEQGR